MEVSIGSDQPVTICESGTILILLHLAGHHAGEIIAPGDRSLISQWSHSPSPPWASTLLFPIRKRKCCRVGNSWGAADCAVTASLVSIKLFFPSENLSAQPTIEDLIATTQRRVAFRKVMGMR